MGSNGSDSSHDDNGNLVPRVLSYPSLRSETGRRENLETRLQQQETALLSSLRVRWNRNSENSFVYFVDFFSVVPSLNTRPRIKIANWLPPTS